MSDVTNNSDMLPGAVKYEHLPECLGERTVHAKRKHSTSGSNYAHPVGAYWGWRLQQR